MKQRLDYRKAAPGAVDAMLGLERYLDESGLDRTLRELVKIRASQLNGCAFCLDMHTRDARKLGESEQRLHVLAAWRDTGFFTGRERAALAWTEALTLLPEQGAPDEIYDELGKHFSEKEIVDLTLAISAINAWNRFGVGFRLTPVLRLRPGEGQPPAATGH